MTVSTETVHSEMAWNRLSAEVLNDLARRDAVVLLPVASTEQHGPHLPTGVDDFLGTAVCRRTAALLAPDHPAVVAPTVWCGLADHHVAFGGTFTVSLATYHALLRDLCRSILAAGFRRIVLVNSHGGNIAALAAFTVELTRELDAPIETTTYFMEAAGPVARILEDHSNVMHACEGETAMMMALAPDLVEAARLPEAHGPAFDVAASLMPTLKRVHGWREVSARLQAVHCSRRPAEAKLRHVRGQRAAGGQYGPCRVRSARRGRGSTRVHLRSNAGPQPGPLSILLHADGQGALFAGDVLHHPVQVAWAFFEPFVIERGRLRAGPNSGSSSAR